MAGKSYLVLYELSRLIINFILLNFLWGLMNLPVLILFFQIALTDEVSALFILIPLLTPLLPILFFPGLQALMSSSRDLLVNEAVFNPRLFFSSFKSGYKNSFLIGMGFTSLVTLIGGVFYLSMDAHVFVQLLLSVLLFYISIVTFYGLIMESHYKMPLLWKLKQAIILILKYPFFSILTFIFYLMLHFIIFTVNIVLYSLLGNILTLYATYHLFLRKLNAISSD